MARDCKKGERDANNIRDDERSDGTTTNGGRVNEGGGFTTNSGRMNGNGGFKTSSDRVRGRGGGSTMNSGTKTENASAVMGGSYFQSLSDGNGDKTTGVMEFEW
jgi:hypothetical protein